MEGLRQLLGTVKAWVEGHALAVGSAGLVALLVGGGVGIAGLASGGTETTSTTEGTVPAAIASTTSTSAPDGSPSTSAAVPVGDGSVMIAVRVDNAPEARPQIGLQDASLVVETPVEGGMTRFTAFYAAGAEPPLVGPVRSLRPVDVALIAPFATTVVATGGQPFVLKDYEPAGVALALPDIAPGFTALERPSPHNLFVRLSEVQSVYPARAVDEPGLPEGSVSGGETAETITIPLPNDVEWSFENGSYVRSEGGSPFEVLAEFDGDPGRYSVDTVVVLFAAERSAGYTDSNDVDVPTFDVVGSGDLLVFHQGSVVAGSWFRSSQEDAYRFFDQDGSSIGLPEGRTHLMVVPRELELDY